MGVKKTVREILKLADIELNGSRPSDIKVKDERFYSRVLSGGSRGLGESYMDGWWACEELDVFFYKILRSQLEKKVRGRKHLWPNIVKAWLFNLQNRSRSKRDVSAHYDIGNELYKRMLDPRMVYSCGYWKDTNELAAAQEAKLGLICRKLGIKEGDRIVDIGCGWGGFVKYAVEKYNAEAVGITLSKEQAAYARKSCRGLPVEIRLQDYRELDEPFDHVISIGMFEHVGYKNYRSFMEVVNRCLHEDGLFMLHTIGTNVSQRSTDPWLNKYIFPNSLIPSIKQIATAAEGLFVMEDWHNFGPYYDRTLMAWHRNFKEAWPEIRNGFDERFYRMWTYYLLMCAGSFRARKNQLWQIVWSKDGVEGGYQGVR